MDQDCNILDSAVEQKSLELGVTMGVATDMPFRIGDRLFNAHRSVLSLYSPVIKALISEQWSESNGYIIQISDEHIDVDIMDDLLTFLYTGRITLTADNTHPVCATANFLGISSLLDHSVKHLCKLLTIENVVQLAVFSNTVQLENLLSPCLLFIKANYAEVFQDSRILELPSKDFKDLIISLKERVWGAKLRTDTFRCIIRWAEKDLTERSNDLPALLKNIPLEELPSDFLTGTVSTHRLVKDSPSCMKTVSAGIENYQTHSETSSKTQQNFIVFGHKSDRNYTLRPITGCYDWQTHVLTELPAIIEPHDRLFAYTVVDKNRIIVAGGRDSKGDATDAVSMFDWTTQTWSQLPRMPCRRSKCSMVFFNGLLYVTGGLTDSCRSTETVQCYSFATRQWKTLKRMISKRIEGQLVEHKGLLYAIGGADQWDYRNYVERYDPVKNEWKSMASMNRVAHISVYDDYGASRYDGQFYATVHDDNIYVLSKASFEVYDIAKNVWADLGRTNIVGPTPILSMNGQLVVVGAVARGVRGGLKQVWRYDTSTQEWIPLFEVDQDIKYGACYGGCPALVGAFH